MKYRTLGNDLTVSAVGLGCMGMSHAYGAPADKKEMTELLARAVDMGYTFFDTAEVYGTPEHPHDNEELVGAALAPYRNQVKIATKFGIHFDMESPQVNKPLVPDSRPEVIRASVEASLKRLGTVLHRPVLPAPPGPGCAGGGSGRRHDGADTGGKNYPLGIVRG